MGPLSGLKVVELAGIGPGPMCAMLLADQGATVLRVDRQQPSGLGMPRPLQFNLLLRSRKAIAVDLKQPAAVEFVLRLITRADALIEGFRPGVMERLGLGPDVCLLRNPRLVYGRMTGWGQTGPLAMAAAHDLNYIAVTGALNSIGRRGQPPTPPLNLVGDFGGGALYLAFGIMSALFEAQRSGHGQVVDAAIVDGTASLMTSYFGLHSGGLMSEERGTNMGDSGSYFYDVYQCADGLWISIAAIETKFHAELLQRLEIDPEALPKQFDTAGWEPVRQILVEKFRGRSRAEWVSLLEGTDVCFAPVLTPTEAPHHPQLAARNTFIDVDGVTQPAPAPRFSRTPSPTPTAPVAASPENAAGALADWLEPSEIESLLAAGMFG